MLLNREAAYVLQPWVAVAATLGRRKRESLNRTAVVSRV
jgi:hypothetical protein